MSDLIPGLSNFCSSSDSLLGTVLYLPSLGVCATHSWGRTRWIGALSPFAYSPLLVRLPLPTLTVLIIIVYRRNVRVLEFRLKEVGDCPVNFRLFSQTPRIPGYETMPYSTSRVKLTVLASLRPGGSGICVVVHPALTETKVGLQQYTYLFRGICIRSTSQNITFTTVINRRNK